MADNMGDQLGERLEITDFSESEVEPLERLMPPEWPDTWRDLARSHFVTLLCEPEPDEPGKCAARAVRLTLGIANDMGGEQHYIPVGVQLLKSRRLAWVIELLESGHDYQETGRMVGLTEPGIRKIERRWRLAKRAAAEAQRAAEAKRIADLQGTLAL